MEHVKKKLAFLADTSAKALTSNSIHVGSIYIWRHGPEWPRRRDLFVYELASGNCSTKTEKKSKYSNRQSRLCSKQKGRKKCFASLFHIYILNPFLNLDPPIAMCPKYITIDSYFNTFVKEHVNIFHHYRTFPLGGGGGGVSNPNPQRKSESKIEMLRTMLWTMS